jgi:cytochrome c-type biogenesis protein CcmH
MTSTFATAPAPEMSSQRPLATAKAWAMTLLTLLLCAMLGASALAKDATPVAADPALEKKLQAIALELRCLVCQNQTIADSNADLAVDLRNQVRDMLKQGKSEREIIDYMTARYGDFVLYRPPVKGSTALLWFGPAVLLIGGIGVLWMVLRRRATLGEEAFEPEQPDPADDAGMATERAALPATSQPRAR